jgi:hypothetical protein
MASGADWAAAYARQADADFTTFEYVQSADMPACHKLHFLQMACEKLVKAHLCGVGTDPGALQTSHAYVAGTLPVVLRQQAVYMQFAGGKAREALNRARFIAQEIEVLTPSVDRNGQRPDNCEYPSEDTAGTLRSPLDWRFSLENLIVVPSGRTVLKLIRGAIDRLNGT